MPSGIRLTHQEFIKRSQNIHQIKYDYSKVNYINYNTKIILICPIHGEFLILPWKHLKGSGCTKCAKKYRKNQFDFLKECKCVHGDLYDYSKSIYKNEKTKVIIICKIHGDFLQAPEKHIKRKHHCPDCGKPNFFKPFDTIDNFIRKSNLIHNNKYDYSNVNYIRSNIKVCIICSIHGDFWQTPSSHLKGRGCPKCKQSKGEKQIEQWLKENNLKYIRQQKFKDCINPLTNYFLYFDFYLSDYNICIEFDGTQHFKPIEYWGGMEHFKQQQFKDEIKNHFCEENNIKLIRISYKEYLNINNILFNNIKIN
jgi:very-short-patch-repair endonuclease